MEKFYRSEEKELSDNHIMEEVTPERERQRERQTETDREREREREIEYLIKWESL